MKKLLLLLLMANLAIFSLLSAQNSQNITLQSEVMRTLGYVCDIKVRNNLAFISGSQNLLMCFDVSNPSQPQLLSYAYHPDHINAHPMVNYYGKLLLHGNYAYFFVQNNQVAIFNISDPNSISHVSDLNTLTDFDCNYTKYGNLLCVAGRANTLKIFNLSTPLQPQLVGSYTFSGSVIDVQVYDDYAYVAHWAPYTKGFKLSVLDIYYPNTPILESTMDGGGSRLILHNNHLFAFNSEGSDSIGVYSLANPISPVLTNSIAVNYQGTQLQGIIEGDILYLRCETILVEGRNGSIFKHWNISNPLQPVPLDDFAFMQREGRAGRFDVENNCIFLSEDYYQIGIYSPANATTITKIGQIQRNSVLNSEYALGHLYLNNGNIINCTTPQADPGFFQQNRYMASEGNTLFTTVNNSIYKWGLCQPNEPALINSLHMWYSEWDEDASRPVNVVGDYLYAGGYILDTNLSVSSIVSNAEIGSPSKVLVRDGYAYTLNYNSVKIFNIADLLNPVLEYTMSFTNGVNDICIENNILIVAPSVGFRVYSLTNPVLPQLLVSKTNVIGIYRVKISGHYLITSGNPGIAVYSIYNPAEPVQTGYYFNEGDLYADLEVVDDIVYVCQSRFLGIYDIAAAVSNPEVPELTAERISLENYPNPFSSGTTIQLKGIKSNSMCEVNVYNLKGQLVKRLHQGVVKGSETTFQWDGRDSFNQKMASGIYLIRLSQDSTTISKRMLLLR